MKCKIGIHTERIEIYFDEETYERVKQALPVRGKKRSWYLAHTAEGVTLRRSEFGAPGQRRDGAVKIETVADTVARHAVAAYDFELLETHLHVPLPPVHEWPWIKDTVARRTKMTPDVYRHHLVQELNARARSATLAKIDTPAIPEWAHRMLTPRERLLHAAGEEI